MGMGVDRVDININRWSGSGNVLTPCVHLDEL